MPCYWLLMANVHFLYALSCRQPNNELSPWLSDYMHRLNINRYNLYLQMKIRNIVSWKLAKTVLVILN